MRLQAVAARTDAVDLGAGDRGLGGIERASRRDEVDLDVGMLRHDGVERRHRQVDRAEDVLVGHWSDSPSRAPPGG
jgi:hypothetical protein